MSMEFQWSFEELLKVFESFKIFSTGVCVLDDWWKGNQMVAGRSKSEQSGMCDMLQRGPARNWCSGQRKAALPDRSEKKLATRRWQPVCER